jgi:hypothetical protein
MGQSEPTRCWGGFHRCDGPYFLRSIGIFGQRFNMIVPVELMQLRVE